jgi:hypothetical protein
MSNLKVRASSWGKLFSCAYSWEGSHLLGMWSPSGARAVIGQGVHAGTAAFDKAKLDGADISIDDAAGVLVDTMNEQGRDAVWDDPKLNKKSAERIALALHVRYCQEIAPQFNYVAVEMETKPLTIECGSGVSITLTGTLDRSRVRAGDDGLGISDLKTGARAIVNGRAETKNHRPQIGTYELLYEHSSGDRVTAPGEIIGMSTSGSNEIATGDIHNARQLMVGDGEHRGLIEYAAEMYRSGLFPPNPQSFTCHPRYCARWNACPYHE